MLKLRAGGYMFLLEIEVGRNARRPPSSSWKLRPMPSKSSASPDPGRQGENCCELCRKGKGRAQPPRTGALELGFATTPLRRPTTRAPINIFASEKAAKPVASQHFFVLGFRWFDLIKPKQSPNRRNVRLFLSAVGWRGVSLLSNGVLDLRLSEQNNNTTPHFTDHELEIMRWWIFFL